MHFSLVLVFLTGSFPLLAVAISSLLPVGCLGLGGSRIRLGYCGEGVHFDIGVGGKCRSGALSGCCALAPSRADLAVPFLFVVCLLALLGVFRSFLLFLGGGRYYFDGWEVALVWRDRFLFSFLVVLSSYGLWAL